MIGVLKAPPACCYRGAGSLLIPPQKPAKLTQKDSISPYITRSSLLLFPAEQLDMHSVKQQRG